MLYSWARLEGTAEKTNLSSARAGMQRKVVVVKWGKKFYLHDFILTCFGEAVAFVTFGRLRDNLQRCAVYLRLIRTHTVMLFIVPEDVDQKPLCVHFFNN